MTLPMLWPNPSEAFGPASAVHDWMRRAACARREIDPDWFTSDDDQDDATERARQVCAGCPVRLLCRLHAEQHQPFGVYAGETTAEREFRLRARELREAG